MKADPNILYNIKLPIKLQIGVKESVKSLNIEVVASDIVLVNADVLRLCVGLMKKLTVGLRDTNKKIIVNKRVHHTGNLTLINLRQGV